MKTNKVLFVFICLALFSCDLFNASLDPDYWEKIDAEIAWANAARLTVTVAVPPEWGSSPQAGENRCYDAVRTNQTPRVGYAFNVEFTPNSGFWFIEWLAFEFTESFRLESISGLDFDEAKGLSLKQDMEITPAIETLTGAFVSSITLSADRTVTLVPFCNERPRITQTNPPLNNSGFSYTRGQEIRIWINLGFTQDKELDFGEGQITIYGQNISDGSPWNGTGDLRDYYEKPVYEASSRSISIKPNYAPPQEENYPPGNCTITVTVGTGLLGATDKGMAAPVSFSYRTSNEIVTRAYKASNVWAIHDPVNDRRVESFFSQTSASDRDRRLRKDSNGDYQITLYFSVSRSMGEIEDPEPDSLTIAEIYYADLSGRLNSEETEDDIEGMGEFIKDNGSFTFEPMESSSNSAGGIYRQMNPGTNPLGVYYYKAVYTFNFDEGVIPGIYRLAILPWRSEGSPPGEAKVEPDEWQDAAAEGRFVTVVIDDDPPGGSGWLNLSGHSSFNEGVYAYTRNYKFLNITTDFSSVRDNGKEGGILLNQAAPNLPWTMDDWSKLSWQWRIVDSEDKELYSSLWLPMENNPAPFDVSSIIAEPSGTPEIHTIEVRYEDTLGNDSEWVAMEKIIYGEPPSHFPANTWRATFTSSNTIHLQWVTPNEKDGVRVEIRNTTTGALEANVDRPGKGTQTYTHFNLPASSGSGKTVISNRYEIDLYAYEGSSGLGETPLPEKIILYNYPDMVSSEANPLMEIDNADGLAAIRDTGLSNPNKHYILINDITLNTPWTTPIGSGHRTSSDRNPFQGKFYGNGKTITVAAPNSTIGIFGLIDNALIRDLEVVYSSSATGSGDNGGLVGQAINNSVILGCGVTGISFSGYSILGGLVGYAQNTRIESCYAAVDVTASGSGLSIGGLLGRAWDNVTVERSWASGNVTASGSSGTYAGGLIGSVHNASVNDVYRNCYARGNVKIDIIAPGSQDLYAGGLIGYFYAPTPNAVTQYGFATGSVEINSSNTEGTNNRYTAAGGIAGYAYSNISNYVVLGTPITARSSGTNSTRTVAYRIVGMQGSQSNSYALSTIQVGTSRGGYNSSIVLRTDLDSRYDGTSMDDAYRKNADFWTGTAWYQMGFDPAVWDTTGVETRGYPLLRDVGGQ